MTDTPVVSFVLECESREADQSAPRTCHLIAPINVGNRNDCWVAEVDPPFIGQPFGLGAKDIDRVIVASKWDGISLFDENRIDIPVYVVHIRDPSVTTNRSLGSEEVEVMFWGIVRRVKEPG